MKAAVQTAPKKDGDRPTLGAVRGEKPEMDEDSVGRIRKVLRQICNELTSPDDAGGKVLLVTHGDVLGHWVEMVDGEIVLECDYCGFVVYKLKSGYNVKPENFELAGPHAEDGVMRME